MVTKVGEKRVVPNEKQVIATPVVDVARQASSPLIEALALGLKGANRTELKTPYTKEGLAQVRDWLEGAWRQVQQRAPAPGNEVYGRETPDGGYYVVLTNRFDMVEQQIEVTRPRNEIVRTVQQLPGVFIATDARGKLTRIKPVSVVEHIGMNLQRVFVEAQPCA